MTTSRPSSRHVALLGSAVALGLVGVGDAWAADPSTAVTALNAEALEAQAPRTLGDLSGFAPNALIGASGRGPGASVLFMRGLGDLDAQDGRDPAVGLRVDGVDLGSNFGQLIDGFDLASVTAERGPSGLFEGRAAADGTITVTRSRPTRRWGLDVAYGLSEGYNVRDETALLNAPAGSVAGLKLSVAHRQRDGYFNNIATGDGVYGRDELTVGVAEFDWAPIVGLEADAEVTLTHRDGQGTPAALGNGLAQRLLGTALALALPGIRYNEDASPFIPGKTTPVGEFDVAGATPDRERLSSQIYSLDIAYDSPVGRMTSISAFAKENDQTGQDLDGGCVGPAGPGARPCNILANPVVAFLFSSMARKYDQFSQEARLTHPLGDRGELGAGVYYFHSDLSAAQWSLTGSQASTSGLVAVAQTSAETNDSLAAFADLNVHVTRGLTLTGGFRYVSDVVAYSEHSDQSAIAGRKTAGRFLTRFMVAYRLLEGASVYAARSEGFRPGGLSPRATLAEAVLGQTNYAPGANDSTFGPEFNTAYELGSTISALRGQLTGGVRGFLTQVTDYQTAEQVLTPGYGPTLDSYVVNIPKVETKGVELDLDYRPRRVTGLTLVGAAGYDDARITHGAIPANEYPVASNGVAGAPGGVYDIAGSVLPRAPKFNMSLRLDYRLHRGPGVWAVNGGYVWTDAQSLGQVAGLSDVQRAYGLADVTVSYRRAFYELSVTGRNLTNQIHDIDRTPALFLHRWGDPRTVIVALRVKL